jgi:hypothetical protein
VGRGGRDYLTVGRIRGAVRLVSAAISRNAEEPRVQITESLLTHSKVRTGSSWRANERHIFGELCVSDADEHWDGVWHLSAGR